MSAIYEAMYYGVMGVVVLIGILALLLFYASQAVFTSGSIMWKSVAYIVAIFDSWLIGAIFGILSTNDVCNRNVEGEHGSAEN